MFAFRSIFPYLDVKNRHAGLHVQLIHRLIEQLILKLHELPDAVAQSLKQSFLFFVQKKNFAETVVAVFIVNEVA
jgi:hypothetical protein